MNRASWIVWLGALALVSLAPGCLGLELDTDEEVSSAESELSLATKYIDWSLRGHYKLDDNGLDASAYGKHGSLWGTFPDFDRFGTWGKALYFDGDNDSIRLTNSNDPHFDLDDFTVSVFAKPQGYPDSAGTCRNVTLLVKGLGEGNNPFTYYFGLRRCQSWGYMVPVYFQSRRLSSGNYQTNGYWQDTVAARITGGQYAHVAFTRSGATLKIYVNGQRITSFYNMPAAPSTPVAPYVGLGPSAWWTYLLDFRGSLDDLRIYSRALSDAEISSLAHN